MAPRLRLTGICKYYPGVRANDDVNLTVQPGRILAVLGENGAGKSTLMRVISGAEQPDRGRIEFDGRPTIIESPSHARRLGISMVHQHFALFETLTVAQNVQLGCEERLSTAKIAERVTAMGQRYGLEVNPHSFVADLTMGERQRVEIIRALFTKPSLLILDEPTSVLTPQAVKRLFDTLRQLAGEGVSIIFISHKLDEIRSLADDCAVLRQGRIVAHVDPRQTDEGELARLMIGADPIKVSAERSPSGDTALSVHQLRLASAGHVCGLTDVKLSVRAREIVGIAGISGNGQSRLLQVISGEQAPDSGSVRLFQRDVTKLDAAARRQMGLRYVPEERLGHGSVPELSLWANALLTGHTYSAAGFVRRGAVQRFSERVVSDFGVATPDIEKQAGALSGGNLQKFIVGREILNQPLALVIDQPTWGVDVGAAAVIHNALLQLRERGAAVLLVSEEIEELLAVCDRIAVMYRGHLSPAVPTSSLTIEEIGLWMAGLWAGSPFRRSEAEAQHREA